MKMKVKVFFWGTFLIFLGIFILMNNFDIFNFDMSELIDWWPILLILWGATLLKIPEIAKMIIASLSAVMLALIIVAMFTGGLNFVDNVTTNINLGNNVGTSCTSQEDIKDSSIKFVMLNFSGGAGKFEINSTDEYFYDINSGSTHCNVEMDKPNDSTAVLNYSFEESGNNISRYTKMDLNEGLVWDLNLSAGASKMSLDLEDLILSNLNIDAGASDADIVFGAKHPLTKVNINCGAANFKISVPLEAGCSVQGDMALANTNFKGLKQNSSGVYISDNYYNSTHKIDFYIDGALSKIKIIRE